MASLNLDDNEISATRTQFDSDGRGVSVDQKFLYMNDAGKVDAHAEVCLSCRGGLHPHDGQSRDHEGCLDPNDSCDSPIKKICTLCGSCRGLAPTDASAKYQVASDSDFQRQWKRAKL